MIGRVDEKRYAMRASMKYVLPVLADIANGIFATFIVGEITETPLTWHFMVGVVLAMLPDIDAVPRLFRTGYIVATKDNPRDHRDYVHYPIVFFLVGLIMAVVSMFWGLLFLLTTMLHFINDTWGTGWGIKWLWPFTDKKYKFSWFDANRQIKTDLTSTTILPVASNEWIDRVYLTINPISIAEYALFAVSVMLLVIYFVVE